ncbi:paraflagellar rod protein 3, putative, partial [Trypanosoma cruzi]
MHERDRCADGAARQRGADQGTACGDREGKGDPQCGDCR